MLQKVVETRTQIEAELLISFLRAAGFHPADLRVWPNVMLAGAELFYSVELPSEEVEAGRQLMREEPADRAKSSRLASTALQAAVVIVIAMIAAGMLLP